MVQNITRAQPKTHSSTLLKKNHPEYIEIKDIEELNNRNKNYRRTDKQGLKEDEKKKATGPGDVKKELLEYRGRHLIIFMKVMLSFFGFRKN